MPLTQNDLQQLAEIRIAEAGVLLANQMWDGAYYLAGYAVECALKACIAKLTKSGDFPDKTFAFECFTHDNNALVRLAQLKTRLDIEAPRGSQKELYWQTLKDWSEKSRYERKTHCNGREADMARLIKEIASGKGLPKRVTDSAAIAFLV
jgi:hypothetical protein